MRMRMLVVVVVVVVVARTSRSFAWLAARTRQVEPPEWAVYPGGCRGGLEDRRFEQEKETEKM